MLCVTTIERLAMIDVAVLLGYALSVAFATPAFARRVIPADSPRLGIAVWLAALSSTALAFLLAMALLALGDFPVRDMLADAVRSCLSVLHHYTSISPLAAGAIVAGSSCLVWLSWIAVCTLRRQRTAVLRHATLLSATGVLDRRLGATIVDHPGVNAYSVPGARAAVVITTGALRELKPAELDAVLAHERAHLAGHHHLISGVAQFFANAFPFLPATRGAGQAIAYYLERLADEAASRATDRRTVAGALVAAGSSPAPFATMGVGGSDVVERVHRLLAPDRSRRWRRMAGGVVVATLFMFPVAVTTAGLIGLAWTDHCLFAPASSTKA